MLQFLTIVGAVLVSMVVYTAIVFAFMHSKLYVKMIKKMCSQVYDIYDVDDL